MGILTGKRGLVVGVSNKWSIGNQIAMECFNQGASVIATWNSERSKEHVQSLNHLSRSFHLDCTSEESLAKVKTEIDGKLDFIIHSIARAPTECFQKPFSETSIDEWNKAMVVSAWSLIGLTNAVLPILNNGASIITISYIGSRRVRPGYNVMGVAKAALESITRELAYELGRDKKIRVNALSAGAIKTTSSSKIKIRDTIRTVEEQSPLRRNITLDDIAKSAAFLVSDMSSGITGAVIDVDSGFNIMLSNIKE